MERLTVKWSDKNYDTFDPVDIVYNEYSKANYNKILTKLGEYEDLEEQGRLIKLPCKVGDTVYHFCEEYGRTLEYGVEKITTTYSCSAYIKRNEGCASECADVIEPDISEFGKTVFLTKSEEGAKRQELRGEENER